MPRIFQITGKTIRDRFLASTKQKIGLLTNGLYFRITMIKEFPMSVIRGKRIILAVFSAALLSFAVPGAASQDDTDFRHARQLEQQGKAEEAFAAFLRIPDAEYAAAYIGRSEPRKYLKILDGLKENIPLFRFHLLEGELLLVSKNDQDALKAFRKAAQNLLADSYPAHPGPNQNIVGPIPAFLLGPGSQKDNWLIQRFIGLKAFDDAEKEFRRIWSIHRKEDPSSRLGLGFSLDFAYFLKTRKKTGEALDLLLEPLRRLTLDIDEVEYISSVGDLFRSETEVTSNKEYIRLVFGFFKNERALDLLDNFLKDSIASGRNACRRTLAFVRLQQGRRGEALGLDLEFIEKASFDSLNAAFHRGLVYDSYGKSQEAVGEFEKAVSLLSSASKPRDDEEAMRRDSLYRIVCQRLLRLYASLGQTGKTLDVTVKQFEWIPDMLNDFESLAQASRNYQAAGKEKECRLWLQGLLKHAPNDLAKANVYWMLNDEVNASRSLAAYFPHDQEQNYTLREAWKERFRKKGQDSLKGLLNELLKANPADTASRLDLLDLEENNDDETLLKNYESLLKGDWPRFFHRVDGPYLLDKQTRFRNCFDIAYRLMRLYEKKGKIDELKKLGLRVAGAEKPFQNWPEELKKEKPFNLEGNGFPEDLNLCLSLLIQHADDPSTQGRLQAAFAVNPHIPSQKQLERRQEPQIQPINPKVFPWANIPAGVTVLAGNENVLSLAHDEKYIYAGHPWGIGVYTMAGKPVTRVALAAAALALTSQGENLWIGTPDGLYRLGRDAWEVNFLDCKQDLPPEERRKSERRYDGTVLSLALDEDILWMGTRRNILAYDTKSQILRVHPCKEEMGLESYQSSGPWNRFFIDKQYVWADGDRGGIRFDKKTRTWKPVLYNKKNVQVIGFAGGRLWGDVNLPDPLRHRPCLIDENTLAVTPLLISGKGSPDRECINSPFALRCEKNGMISFNLYYEYDLASRQFRERREAFQDELTSTFGINYNEAWRMIRLDNGEWIMARGVSQHHPYDYYHDPNDKDLYADLEENEGGLYLLNPQKRKMQRLSFGFSDSLAADEVFSSVDDGAGNTWICTEMGLDRLDGDGRIIAHYSKSDGLLANRILAGAVLKGKLYFASGWWAHAGGLIVYDPQSRVFTALVKSDGLPSEHLRDATAEADRLRLEFLPEYLGSSEYLLNPPAYLDPLTRTVRADGKPEKTKFYSPDKNKAEKMEPMPYLGGFVRKKTSHAGKTYLLGSRGMVIVGGQKSPGALVFPPLKSTMIHSLEQARNEEVNKTQIVINSPNDLHRYMKSSNGLIRAEAISKLRDRKMSGYLDILAGCSEDSDLNVRSSAVYLLAREKSSKVVPALRTFLNDSNDYIRAVAACGLAEHSVLPDLKHFKEILEDPDRFGNLPFGAEGSRGVAVSESEVYRVLAPLADSKIFEFLLQYPLSRNDEPEIFAMLGPALRKHPDAGRILLKAYRSSGAEGNPEDFSRDVFEEAGKELLPVLHQALSSPDRIVRSNAARACGAIAHPSSIRPLIKALDLESGLSRASIVWALGQLKAQEALPYLVELYALTKQDDQSRPGYRIANASAKLKADYDALGNLDYLRFDGDQLAAARSLKPAREEPGIESLLTSNIILGAIKNIDISLSRDFYRQLAGTADDEARREAASNLGRVPPAIKDLEKDLQVLQALCADPDFRVRAEAAVSLLILNNDAGAGRLIKQWLGGGEKGEVKYLLSSLLKVTDGKKLFPFCDSIQKFFDETEGDLRQEWKKICAGSNAPGKKRA